MGWDPPIGASLLCAIQNEENVNDLAYWLSTTSTLLSLLQNTLKAINTSSKASQRSRTPVRLFGRMVQVSF